MVKQNGYLILEPLSDIELYFTPSELIQNDELALTGEEFHHSVNVMRHSADDILFVTDGEGRIVKSQIVRISKTELISKIIDSQQFDNHFKNIWFCIPSLKSTDRLKFAIEKCVELGITNFILLTSRYTISKKVNPQKFEKTALAAMKQSLRSFIPKIISASFDEIVSTAGEKIIFDQKSKNVFNGLVDLQETTYLLFGPEGGFDPNEIGYISQKNRYSLSSNRLRSETAIIKCASLLKF